MKKWTTKNGLVIYRVLSGRSNVFMVSNGKDCFLVDTGIKLDRKTLIDRISRICGQEIKLRALVLTHAHFDHAANAESLRSLLNTDLIINRQDEDYLLSGNSQAPAGTNSVLRALTDLLTKKQDKFGRFEPVKACISFDKIHELNIPDMKVKIIHTPGHTAGSASVIVDDEIAIVGDAMFGIFPNSVFPPFATDIKAMVESWKVLLDTGCQLYLPSHGNENTRELLQRQYDKYKTKI